MTGAVTGAVTAGPLSPLVVVEREAQARAKDIALDASTDDGLAKLRALVDDEVARWSSDYKRGQCAWCRDSRHGCPRTRGATCSRNRDGEERPPFG